MRRIIFATLFQLLAVAAIVLSFQPCVALFVDKFQVHRPRGYTEELYFSSMVFRSWLIALAGIGIGSTLLWIGSCIKPKESVEKPHPGLLGMVKRRIAILSLLIAGALVVFAFRPELSACLGISDWDNHKPFEVSTKPGGGMVFMVLTNDLVTPLIEYHPPYDTNFEIGSNASITLPSGYNQTFNPANPAR